MNAPLPRWHVKRIPPPTPPPKQDPAQDRLQWAVWLGANTYLRLAREWRIPRRKARAKLQRAAEAGILLVDRSQKPLRYSVPLGAIHALPS